MKRNKVLFTLCSALVAATVFASGVLPTFSTVVTADETKEITALGNLEAPKYVFLFIGDGMTYPQIQIASDYLGVKDATGEEEILEGGEPLSFMNFDVAGSATTYDSTSFCPDSASTATSISTGQKTYSGVINMDETLTTSYETIAETLKEEFGYKIGIVSSVNLNHATPAAFYAHQPTRSNYYEIGQELVDSDFEYFGGGALISPTGSDEDQESIYDIAEDAGYEVITTTEEARKVDGDMEKVIIIGEDLDSSGAIPYAIDADEDSFTLADYVSTGIEVLDNEDGFFMMVEGGKIDWAGHANDAATVALETIALAEAVAEAVEFYNEHPDETLILVTGDHETGGLSIGYAGTNYDTFLQNIDEQEISYNEFTKQYVSEYIENETSFEDVMEDVEELFGLRMPDDNEDNDDTLELTEYEVSLLQEAYDKTMSDYNYKEGTQEEYVLYGSYDPLTVTITSILNNKSGVAFTSYSHTGLPVAVFAQGVGEDLFSGYYDNTDIYNKLISLFY